VQFSGVHVNPARTSLLTGCYKGKIAKELFEGNCRQSKKDVEMGGKFKDFGFMDYFEDVSSANADCSVNFEGHGDEGQEMEMMMRRESGNGGARGWIENAAHVMTPSKHQIREVRSDKPRHRNNRP
jgi:hypothetical protein